jgi:hypothetical protein
MATQTVTIKMQRNMKTRAHQAKLGKVSRTSEYIDEMKAISHASWTGQLRIMAVVEVCGSCSYDCDGYGGEGKGIPNDT